MTNKLLGLELLLPVRISLTKTGLSLASSFHNPTHCFCSMWLGSLLYGLVGELLVLPEELLVLLGVLPDLVLLLLRR